MRHEEHWLFVLIPPLNMVEQTILVDLLEFHVLMDEWEELHKAVMQAVECLPAMVLVYFAVIIVRYCW